MKKLLIILLFPLFVNAQSPSTCWLWNSNGNDAIGSSNATVGSSVVYANGKFSSCIVGDGGYGTNDIVTFSNTTIGAIGIGQFAIEIIAYLVDPGSGHRTDLFSNYGFSSPYSGEAIIFDPDNIDGRGDKFGLQIDTYVNQLVSTTAASPYINKWVDIILQRTATNLEFWINGVLDKQSANSVNITTTPGSCFIGSKNSSTIAFWSGEKIGRVTIWKNGSLSPAYIKNLYIRYLGEF